MKQITLFDLESNQIKYIRHILQEYNPYYYNEKIKYTKTGYIINKHGIKGMRGIPRKHAANGPHFKKVQINK